MGRAQGANARLIMGFEDVYGTAPAGSKFWTVPFASTSLGSSRPLLSSELLGAGREALTPIGDGVTADGDVQIPLCSRNLGPWLRLLFGDAVVTGEGPYTHTFESGAVALPSASFEVGNPEVPSYRTVVGVMANSFTFQMTARGLITASVSCIGRGEETPTATSRSSGAVEMPLDRFGAFNGAIYSDGALLGNVTSGSINYSNGLQSVETIRPDGMIEGVDVGAATLTGEMVVRFADTTLLDKAHSGVPMQLTYEYKTVHGTAVRFNIPAAYLPVPRLSVEGPNGMQATFAWQSAKTVTERMVTVELDTDVASFAAPN